MSNVRKVKRPDVFIELDRKRKMRYTLNSFAEMEERYGSVDAALKALEGNSFKAVRFMLWLGLLSDDPEITEVQIGDMIEVEDLEEMANKMTEVMTGDLPAKAVEGPNV